MRSPHQRHGPRLLHPVFLLLAGAPLAAQDRPLPEPSTRWYRVEIAGQRVGHGMVRIEHVERDAEVLLRYTETGSINMGRLGAAVEITTETVYLERADGSLIECVTRSDMSNRESVAKAVFDATTARLSTTTAGRTRETETEIPADMVGPLAAQRALLAALERPGTSLPLTTWAADMNDVVEVVVEIGTAEQVEVADGSRRSLVRVAKHLEGLPMDLVSWHDAAGTEVVSRLKTSGIEIVSLLTSEADALAEFSADVAAGDIPDVFAATLVHEPYALPAARQVGRALIRVAGRDGPIPVPIPESPTQRVVRGDPEAGTELLFELRSRQPAPGHGARRPLAATDLPAELGVYLTASSSLQSDAAEIQAAAQAVVGDETDAWIAAQRLESWVEQHVAEKGMDVAWASSLEVLEDRSGDCSEHAVLLAALCRAAGIPCRVAMGSLYIGGTWAGHAWNEVWIANDWYALDATLGMGHADAMRVTLGTLSLEDGGGGSAEFASLAGNLGSLAIETLELGSGARTRRPATDHGRIEAGAYVDRLFGIRFDLPEGVPLTVRRPGEGISFDLLDTAPSADDATADDPLTEDPPFRFRLRAYDATADGGPPPFLPIDRGTPVTIDGRPAWSFRGDTERGFVVLSAGSAFELRFQGIDCPADEQAVTALIQSVDFDRSR